MIQKIKPQEVFGMNKSFSTLFAFFWLSVLVFAQTPKQETVSPAPTGLVLEVTFLKGRPPAYLTISELGSNSNRAWYSLFGRVPSFKPPTNALPVRAVNIVPSLDKDTIKVSVSVLTGEKMHEKEEAVGVYSLKENERLVIKELTNFGVEPFGLALLRLTPTASELPTVVNKTSSLQVVGLEPNVSTLPSFKIKLLNASNKAIVAYAFETRVGNQKKLSGMPQGAEGEALIESGATFETQVRNSLQYVNAGDGRVPPVQPNQQIVILAAVFADGSYEGEPTEAARFRGFLLGRKMQINKIVGLLKKSLESEPSASIENLSKQVAGLANAADDSELTNLRNEFAMLGDKEKANLKISVEVAANGVKQDFLKALEELKQNSDFNAKTIRSELSALKTGYENWLAKLP